MLDATTGRVIIRVVKIGAQLLSPNQMIEITIQTNTEVELRTARPSATTPRPSGERNASRPSSTAATTAPPKPTAIRASDAPVWRQISPERTMSPSPDRTESGVGRTKAP